MSATDRLKPILFFSILLGLILLFLGLLLFVLPPSGEDVVSEEATPEKSEEAPPDEGAALEEAPPGAEGAGEVEDPGEEGAPIPEARYRIYLVVDDAGHDLEDLEPYLSLPVPVTVAILPDRPASEATLTAATAAGVESILHLPMEPAGEANPGAGAIFTTQTDDEIAFLLKKHLSTLPGVLGVNNHMGSLATADPRVMGVVMSTLSEEGLFFLDSRTTPESVARDAAEARGVPFAERSVFLDNERSDDAVGVQLDEAAALAEEEGYAIAIGHVTSDVVATVVAKRQEEYRRRGIAFYPLSALF